MPTMIVINGVMRRMEDVIHGHAIDDMEMA